MKFLKDEFPNIFAQLVPELNKDIKLETISCKSAKNLFWRCERNHIFVTKPMHRTSKKGGCPCCSGRVLCLNKTNSLLQENPTLATEFSPKNNVSPNDIINGGGKLRYIWKCSKGHEWSQTIKARKQHNSGCPVCAGNRPAISEEKTCLECGQIFYDKNSLHTHIAVVHKNLNEYKAKTYFGLEGKPVCEAEGCSEFVPINRGRSAKFQKYCSEKCASRKMSEERFCTLSEEIEKEGTFKVVTKYKSYNGFSNSIEVKCRKCKKKSTKRFNNALYGKSSCFYCSGNTSKGEREVREFIESLNVKTIPNYRKALNGLEIDIFCPEYQIGVEYNGLYYHSEKFLPKKYHLEKTKLSEEKNIRLIHIWEDDWRERPEIVKSMLKHAFGLTEHKAHARKLKVLTLDKNSLFMDFFNDNHIEGHVISSVAFALVDANSEILACLSMRTPIHYKGCKEISRFAIKRGYSIPGAFPKLFKVAKLWTEKQNCSKIVTYSHRSHGTGNLYEKNGFQFLKNTPLDYWYTDGTNRMNRFKFRAQDGLTESQVAKEHDVLRIFGCGSKVFIKDI